MQNDVLLSPDVQDGDLIQIWKTQVLQHSNALSPIVAPQSAGAADFLNWFESFTLQKQEQIVRSSQGVSANVSPGELLKEQEMNFLRQFLFRYKMIPADESVFTRISDEDFIEIYDAEGIQIYRRWSFFKFCRYTIDQILTKSWGELYERPQFVEKKLYAMMPSLFQRGCGIVDYNIEDFVLSERYLDPPSQYLVKMKFACPLLDSKTKATVAFLSIAQARRLEN